MPTNPNGDAVFSGIDQIKREHDASGGYFFSPGAMGFFNSTIYSTLYGPRHNVFVTREVFESGSEIEELYSVRTAEWNDDHTFLDITTAAGGFSDDGTPVFETRAAAVAYAKANAAIIAP